MKEILTIYFLFLSFISFSQELIKNGDFEAHSKFCFYSSICGLKNWKTNGSGAADYYYYHDGKNKVCSGSCYMGFHTDLSNNQYVWNEYISQRLTQKLKRNEVYCFSFYIKLEKGNRFCHSKFEFVISEKPIQLKPSYRFIRSQSYYDISSNDSILDKETWVQLYATFKAKGGEEWITIGKFDKTLDFHYSDLKARDQKKGIMGTVKPYYLIDLVSLKPISDSSDCDCIEKRISFTDFSKELITSKDTIPFSKGDIIRLSDIHFESNSYELMDSSRQELEKLYNLLSEYPELRIKINGHTDNVGKEKTNLRLSERRAKAIVDYLIEKGIDIKRLAFEGYGEYMPLTPNTTEEGRSENRRVEFEIVE